MPEIFIDWLVCVENAFTYKPKTDGHKATLVAIGFCSYPAI